MRENFFSIQADMVLNGKNISGTAEFDTKGVTFLSESTTLFYQEVNWKDIKIELSEERVQTFLFFKKKKYSLVLRAKQSALPSIIFSKELKDDFVNKLNQLCRNAQERYYEEVRQQKFEKERQRKQEEERRQKLEEERQRKLEEERRQKLEEERQQKFEEKCLREQEEERQRKLEEERSRKLDEERQQKIEEERLYKLKERFAHILGGILQRKLEEERLKKLKKERQRKQEEERQQKIEEERLYKLKERFAYILGEILQRKLEEERLKKIEEGLQYKLEEERKKKLEEEYFRRLEEEYKKKLEEECQRKLEEERQQKLEEEHKRKLEEERQQKLEEDDRLRKLEEERQQKLEVERQRKLEAEHRQKLEKERQRKLEAEHRQKLEEEPQRKLEVECNQEQDLKQETLLEQGKMSMAGTHQLQLEYVEDRQYCNHSLQETLDYPECNEFKYFTTRFVYDCRDARVEILAEHLLAFLTDYYDTSNGKISKIDLVDKGSELVTTLNQMSAGFGYESIMEDFVMNAIRDDYYDPCALRQSLEEVLIDYNYTLRLNSDIYLQEYSDSYGLKYVRESNSYYIEKSSIYESSVLDEIIEEKERKDLYSQLASIRQDQIERIRNFVEKQKRPISKDLIKVKFPECSSVTISSALNHSGILHYGKHILSVNHLNISISEKNALRTSIRRVVGKSDSIIHVKVLYDRIHMQYYDLFMRLFIDNEDHLFNVINFLYSTDFSFKEPYLARRGTVIPSPEDRLRQYAFDNEELDIDDYLSYSRDNYIKIAGILNSINLLNSRMLLKNRDRLIRIEKTGISLAIVKTVESLIYKELNEEEAVALRDLNCVTSFPVINIPWDEWFIYSILNKWGNKLFLYTTAPQFRNSIPVVSKNSFVTAEELQSIANKHSGDIDRVLRSSIDDLDNLDDLIEEIIDLDDIEDLDDLELSLSDYGEELY